MPNLSPHGKADKSSGEIAAARCSHCRHIYISSVGIQALLASVAPVATEFYQRGARDSGFTFSPATGKWRPWVGDDED